MCDGKAKQEVVTERILMQQHGDQPPVELQKKLDQLASCFEDYDISLDSTGC